MLFTDAIQRDLNLKLCHLIDSIDVIDAFAFILAILMNGINTDIAWLVVRLRFTAPSFRC